MERTSHMYLNFRYEVQMYRDTSPWSLNLVMMGGAYGTRGWLENPGGGCSIRTHQDRIIALVCYVLLYAMFASHAYGYAMTSHLRASYVKKLPCLFSMCQVIDTSNALFGQTRQSYRLHHHPFTNSHSDKAKALKIHGLFAIYSSPMQRLAGRYKDAEMRVAC